MQIKVGARTYMVEKPEEIIEVGGELYGKHSSRDSTIQIAAKFDQLQQNQTLMHELLHAVCEMQCLDEINGNEQWVDLLAKGLHMVIVDNPKLFTMADI